MRLACEWGTSFWPFSGQSSGHFNKIMVYCRWTICLKIINWRFSSSEALTHTIINCLHEFAQWTIVWIKQFRVTHCVACCHWKVCNSCLIQTVQRCSPCGVLLLKKVYTLLDIGNQKLYICISVIKIGENRIPFRYAIWNNFEINTIICSLPQFLLIPGSTPISLTNIFILENALSCMYRELATTGVQYIFTPRLWWQ